MNRIRSFFIGVHKLRSFLTARKGSASAWFLPQSLSSSRRSPICEEKMSDTHTLLVGKVVFNGTKVIEVIKRLLACAHSFLCCTQKQKSVVVKS